MTNPQPPGSDHDLLIEVRTDLKNLITIITGNVPNKCIEHGEQISTLRRNLNTLYYIGGVLSLALGAGFITHIITK